MTVRGIATGVKKLVDNYGVEVVKVAEVSKASSAIRTAMPNGRKPASESSALAGTYTQQLNRCRTQTEYTPLCKKNQGGH